MAQHTRLTSAIRTLARSESIDSIGIDISKDASSNLVALAIHHELVTTTSTTSDAVNELLDRLTKEVCSDGVVMEDLSLVEITQRLRTALLKHVV